MTSSLSLHALQRHVLGQRPVGDHHGGGVRADVAGQALDLHGQVEQLADLGVGVVRLSSGRRSSRAPSSSVMSSSSGTMATIASTRGMGMPSARPTSRIAARAASVPNVPIWATFVCAVLVLDVLDDLAAAVLAEVDVDIGRFAAALVEEPLEQQVVFQRADVAQIQRVGDERADARCRGPWPECPARGRSGRNPRRSESNSAKPSLLITDSSRSSRSMTVGRQLAVRRTARRRRRSAPAGPSRHSSRR